jgi:hypothetical protein
MTETRNLLVGLGSIPMPPPQNLLAEALYRRPRTRSEWEARLAYWQRPASETEEAKIEAAARRIRTAFAASPFLAQRSWSIIKQGSYHNNTNVRLDSDIDLAVCLDDSVHFEGPNYDQPTLNELNMTPLPFTFEQYKSHIAWCLHEEFGHAAINIGNKAIHLNKQDQGGRVKADIVPAFTFRKYAARQGLLGLRAEPHTGIAIQIPNGAWITNFPSQHYENGCAKTAITGRRYKRVVRILKRLRNHISDNPSAPEWMRSRAKATPSFLIECLVYNCPNALFGASAIYNDVLAVLHDLRLGLPDPAAGATLLSMPRWALWTEVNEIKPLFSSNQAWTVAEATEFVDSAITYLTA